MILAKIYGGGGSISWPFALIGVAVQRLRRQSLEYLEYQCEREGGRESYLW